MYIHKYIEFINENISEPVPELKIKNKKMIFLIGPPAAGKTEFSNYFLIPKLTNYKIFDPDKYSYFLIKKFGKEPVIRTKEEKLEKSENIKRTILRLQTEYDIPINLGNKEIMDIIDNNVWVENVDKLIETQLNKFMTSNKYSDIIIDTTGNDYSKIHRYFHMAKENGYSTIFIKIKTEVKTAVLSNLSRGRKVQLDYQLDTIEKGGELEVKYLNLNPDAFYVFDRDLNILSKYENNILVIKKQRLIKKN